MTRIIISGTIDMPPENVAPALEAGRPLIDGALTEEGCLDYDCARTRAFPAASGCSSAGRARRR